MKIDFWNNPLIVSGLRLRFRSTSPTTVVAIFLLAICVLGAFVYYLDPTLTTNWPRTFLLGMFMIQLPLCGILASSATSNSMRLEVSKRTLDLQLMAPITPRQFLLGKLLGEAAIPFLFAISTMPIGFVCVLFGAASVPILILLYVNLLCGTFLAATVGLVCPPDNRGEFKVDNSATIPLGLLCTLFLFPPLAAAVGTGEHLIETLLLVPCAELAVAFLCFHYMERKLVSPFQTAIHKSLAYGIVLLADLIVVYLLVDFALISIKEPNDPIAPLVLFHTLTAFILIGLVTPFHEVLSMDAWRRRGQLPSHRDVLLHGRTVNTLALAVFALAGALTIAGSGLAAAYHNEHTNAVTYTIIAQGAILTAVLVLLVGTLYQLASAIRSKLAGFVVGAFILAELGGALLSGNDRFAWVGVYFTTGHVRRWAKGETYPMAEFLQLMLLYLLVLGLALYALRAVLNRLRNRVIATLTDMGVDLS